MLRIPYQTPGRPADLGYCLECAPATEDSPRRSDEKKVADEKKCPARSVHKGQELAYTARVVNGELFVKFGDGKQCTVVSVEKVTGTLLDDKVTVKSAVKDGQATVKANVTGRCGENKITFDGFTVNYDESINEINIDTGTPKPPPTDTYCNLHLL